MREYIYTLKSNLLNRVVKDYIDYITNPLNRHRQDDEYFENELMGNEPKATPMPLKVDKYTGKILIWNLPRPSYNNAEAKVRMIVDTMYRAYLRSEEDLFHVKSTLLKKITEQYKYILDVLFWNFVIGRQYNYTEDNKNDKTKYWINDPKVFHLIKVSALNGASKKEVHRFDKWSEEKQEKKTQEIIQATSKQFVERYNQSLRQLRINETSAMEYIYTQQWEKDHSPLSRIYTVKKISQKHRLLLTSIDNNGRLYHIGTELQRDIKPYTNIKFSLDCKNSHPYLLSAVVIRHIILADINIREIDWRETLFSTLLYNVTRYLSDNNGIYLHNEFSDRIRKNLEQSSLRKREIARILTLTESLTKIKPDVWQYIYDAASGKVWDYFVEQLNEERTTVKKEVFQTVVYSYKKRRNKKKETEDKWLKAFIDRYPTVYDIIVNIKKSLHKQCVEQGQVEEFETAKTFKVDNFTFEVKTKDKVLLPTLMMRLESRIFTEILKRLFKKRITCFGIHDAVAVINPKKMTIKDIKDIILGVYRDYGMMPTLSVEYYGDK